MFFSNPDQMEATISHQHINLILSFIGGGARRVCVFPVYKLIESYFDRIEMFKTKGESIMFFATQL